MSSISRIYGKVLKIRVEREYADQEVEEQAGFRTGISTIDHIFCVTQLLDKMSTVNKEVHLLFVNLKKATGEVVHGKLY